MQLCSVVKSLALDERFRGLIALKMTAYDLSYATRWNQIQVRALSDPRLRGIPKVQRSPRIANYMRLSFGSRSRILNMENTFENAKKDEDELVNGEKTEKRLNAFEYFKLHRSDEDLDLSGWSLDKVTASGISMELPSCANIVRLSLANSSLKDEGGKIIAKGLEENFSVRELDLTGNMLGENAISAIGEMLNKNQTLEKLNLSRNNLTDHDVQVFLNCLCRKTFLKDLDLSSNILCDQFAKQMSFVLEKNFVLEKLSIYSNQLEASGLQAISSGLRKTKTLSFLNISWNYLRDAGAEILGEIIAENRGLVEISACGNLLTTQSTRSLATGVSSNSRLKILRIGQNLIKNSGAYEFVKVLFESGKPISLETLDINGTIVDRRFKELIETGLPENLSSLKVVNFSVVECFVNNTT